MNIKRVGTLLGKEFSQGSRNSIFIWAIIAPIVFSLVISLLFGTMFTEKPKLGIMDKGSSQLVTMSKQLTSVITREYSAIPDIKEAVEIGAIDIGIVLPDDFDTSVMQAEDTEITAYVWGESLAKNRAILAVTITNLARELSGQETPVEIVTITLGDDVTIPWNDRLLPFIVLIAVFMGGLILPAVSVIQEKEKKTLEGLIITPASIGDVFAAKGLLGITLSLLMGIVVLVLNQAFGAQPALLILVLALGAVMAGQLGLLLGALVKDTTTLFAILKVGSILLYVPAIIYMFPGIPEWISKIFPTYYLMQPVIEISQRGGSWPEIATHVFILIGLDLVLVSIVAFTLNRAKQQAV